MLQPPGALPPLAMSGAGAPLAGTPTPVRANTATVTTERMRVTGFMMQTYATFNLLTRGLSPLISLQLELLRRVGVTIWVAQH